MDNAFINVNSGIHNTVRGASRHLLENSMEFVSLGLMLGSRRGDSHSIYIWKFISGIIHQFDFLLYSHSYVGILLPIVY